MGVDWPATLARALAAESLDRATARTTLGEILDGSVEPVVIAAWLTALTAKGESAGEIVGFVDAMMDRATTISVPTGTMDVVGTGGDRSHSVNVSTMAALTVAACGVPVAKHGNRAATSAVGAADVLEALGVKIDAAPEVVARCVTEVGIGFCFAPTFHPGMRHLGAVRRQLGFPTVMNLLGPLANPAGVRRLVVGTARADTVRLMAEVLQSRGVERAVVLHSEDGLDELSLAAPATVVDVDTETISARRIDAAVELGASHPSSALRGGDVATNARAVHEFLASAPGAIFDVVTANAGLALVVAGRADDLREGAALAADAVRRGDGRRVLDELVRASNAS